MNHCFWIDKKKHNQQLALVGNDFLRRQLPEYYSHVNVLFLRFNEFFVTKLVANIILDAQAL